MSVMIGIPIKNAESWLPKSIEQLKSLSYPHDKIRIVYEYSKSDDKTLEILKEFSVNNDGFKVEVYKEPFDENLVKYGIQMSAVVYKDFQSLITEDYFMLYDSDIIQIPTDLIESLIEIDADIVAPYPWSEGHRHFYDSWIFRYQNYRWSPKNPPGYGDTHPIITDSVGTCFLAKYEVFKSSPIDNPYPNLTFCNSARKLGYNVVAVPYIEVFHIDFEKLGIMHYPLPQEFGNYPNPGFVDNNSKLPEYIRKEIRQNRIKTDIDNYAVYVPVSPIIEENKKECE